MIELYVPEEITFNGITYSADTTQQVPQEVADYIQSDPVLSTMKPNPKPDKFGQFVHQPLTQILTHIQGYENNIEAIKKEIHIKELMGSPVPKEWLVNLKNNQEELSEFKAYIDPFVALKRAEEAHYRKCVEDAAESRGATITWLENGDGRYTEHLQPKKVIINKNIGDKE